MRKVRRYYMGYYKDKERKTWFVEVRYKDIYGTPKKKKKRGFKTATEAKKWEMEFLNSLYSDPEINFSNLYKNYFQDLSLRLKPSTLYIREINFRKHFLPYFGEMKIKEISPLVIREWQNKILSENYSEGFMTTLHRQLTSFFNYAIKFYNLKNNPCSTAGKIKISKPANEIQIWTPENFNLFISKIRKPEVRLAFQILFYTGMRSGELMALNFNDIDYSNNTIKISKSYYKIAGKGAITTPKTDSSNRSIICPTFLLEDIKTYYDSLYQKEPNQKIFMFAKDNLRHYIRNYSEILNIPRIRVHDLRHSYASYLLQKNVSILAISKQLGHKDVKLTLSIYSHLLPEANDYLKEILNNMNK